jgi:hypothetical protein
MKEETEAVYRALYIYVLAYPADHAVRRTSRNCVERNYTPAIEAEKRAGRKDGSEEGGRETKKRRGRGELHGRVSARPVTSAPSFLAASRSLYTCSMC